MKDAFRQSMAWLHTWAGLVVGWLLLAIFVTGTATYYRLEITSWMHPEISPVATVSQVQALQGAMAWLQQNASDASAWQVELPGERLPVTHVSWQGAGQRRFNSQLLDPGTGKLLETRKTQGGDFFYAFHFQLNLPPIVGRWIVGAAAMIMFVALVSGIIIHKRIFKDFFTLRFGKGQRSWLDAHNSLSVLALPFHLLITYTGLITLMYLYMPWGANALYGSDSAALYRDVLDYNPPPPRAAEPGGMASAASLVEQAQASWGNGHLASVSFSSPGAANSQIELSRDTTDQLSSRAARLRLDGADGRLLEASSPAGPAKVMYGLMYGLHMAHFADPLLRALLFISGVGGSLMVATGVQLWVVKRRKTAPGWLHRRVEGLNVAAILGLPLAMASYFWANRLLGSQLAGREHTEVKVFFAVWLIASLHSQFRTAHRVWQEQAALCSLAFLALPLLDAVTRPGASTGWVQLEALANGFNLAMLVCGGGFAVGFAWLRRPRTLPPGRALRQRPARTELPQ